MKRKNATRNALFTSVLSLLLCVSMLVGTTFAWFTDEVESGVNTIAAGNLDVELEYKKVENGQWTAWKSVEGETEIFDRNALWEPGHTEVVCLKVSNLGSLALKYQLGVNVADETPGTNVAGEEFKLSDHLVFKVLNYGDQELTNAVNREFATSVAGTTLGLKDYNGNTTKLEVDGSDYLVLIVYMPETVGNEANYKTGTTQPKIELGVNLFATQVEAESDSYGDDYDEDAWNKAMKVYTADDLNLALANVADGDVIRFESDITVTSETATTTNGYIDGIVYTGDKSFTIDLNGYTLSDDGSLNDYLIYLKNNGENANEITIQNGAITVNSQVWSAIAVNSASYTQTSVLNLDNVIVTVGNKENWSNDAIRARHGATINLNEGTVINSVGTAYGVTANYTGVLNINSGAKVVQSESGTSGGNYPFSAVSGTGTVNIYEGAVIESDCYGIHNMTTQNPVINIYGGTITAPKALHASTNGAADQSATINVYNGTINGALSTYSANGHIVVTGGVFTADPSAYVAEGYTAVESNGLYYISTPDVAYVKTSTGVRNALEAGKAAILMNNVSLGNITVEIGTGVEATLDLNGYTLTNNNVAPIKINGGTLTLKDSGENGAVVAGSTSSDNDAKAAILFGENGGKFVMESGTLRSTKYAVRSYYTPSEIVINGGTIEAESYGVYDSGGSVTMNGGTINSNFYGIAAYGTFIMNDGEITAPCAYLSHGTVDDTVAVINGGELNGTVYNGIYWPSAGSLTINGGTITGVNGIYVRSGSLNITGGTLTGTGENETALTIENIGGNSGYQEITKVSVTGGTFASVSGPAVTSITDTTGSNPDAVAVTGFVKGGTYTSDPSAYLAEGYTAEKNEDDTYSVCAYVSSADELVAALAQGGTIVLTADIEVSSPLAITANTVIDGNGEILTYTGSARAIEIANNADYDVDVTIKNLTVDCSAGYCERGINYNDNGTLTLDNVTVKGDVTYGINLPGKSTGATVVINGGSYSAAIALNVWGANSVVTANNVEFITVDNTDGEGYAAVKLNNAGDVSAENAVININGGSITITGSYCDDSYAVTNATLTGVINISETTEVTGQIVEGYVSVVRYNGTDNFYSHTSLQNSVKCVEEYNSGWVVLLTDITVDSLEVNGDVSIDTNGYTLTVGSYTGDGKLTVDGTVVYGN